MGMDNPRALRDAFGAFMTGVTVVTTKDEDGNPLGFTANSFSSVSLDPPMLLVCLANSSSNYDVMVNAPSFAVNILSEDQKDLSNTFASKVEDRFAGTSWKEGPLGSPIFNDLSAWFDCEMHQVVDAGDHAILIGEVKGFENGSASGLGYARGAYFTSTTEVKAQEISANPSNTNVVVSSIIEHEGSILMLEGKDGELLLPTREVKQGVPSKNVTALLDEVDAPASVGFVYSVYEDENNNTQNLAYHCVSASNQTKVGAYYEMGEDTWTRVKDKASKEMLRRLEAESRMDNYGIYFGNQDGGQVRPILQD